MLPIKAILDKKRVERKTGLDSETLFFVFSKIISEYFGTIGRNRLRPDYLSGKTLFVKAESPVWGNELWLNRKAVIDRINQELGEPALREIKLK